VAPGRVTVGWWSTGLASSVYFVVCGAKHLSSDPSAIVARGAVVAWRWLADLDGVVLLVAGLDDEVLCVERAALVGCVADLRQDALLGLRLWPVNNLAGAWPLSGPGLGVVRDLDGLDRVGALDGRGGCAGRYVVVRVHGDECSSGPVADAALNCPQQAADLEVVGWDLHTNGLVRFFGGGVGVAVCFVVDEAGDLLGQAVADVTQLLALAVDLVGVVAVGTLASVGLEVVGGPGLGGVDRPGDALDGVFVEANHSLLLGGGVDDGGLAGAEVRHGGGGGVLQNGARCESRCEVGAKLVWNGSDGVTLRKEQLE
jgi:hypothetical protein